MQCDSICTAVIIVLQPYESGDADELVVDNLEDSHNASSSVDHVDSAAHNQTTADSSVGGDVSSSPNTTPQHIDHNSSDSQANTSSSVEHSSSTPAGNAPSQNQRATEHQQQVNSNEV